MTCVSVGKPVVVGQATGTAWGKPDDLARYSAALDPGDGGGSDRADHSRARQDKDNPNGHWWVVFLLSLNRYRARCLGWCGVNLGLGTSTAKPW